MLHRMLATGLLVCLAAGPAWAGKKKSKQAPTEVAPSQTAEVLVGEPEALLPGPTMGCWLEPGATRTWSLENDDGVTGTHVLTVVEAAPPLYRLDVGGEIELPEGLPPELLAMTEALGTVELVPRVLWNKDEGTFAVENLDEVLAAYTVAVDAMVAAAPDMDPRVLGAVRAALLSPESTLEVTVTSTRLTIEAACGASPVGTTTYKQMIAIPVPDAGQTIGAGVVSFTHEGDTLRVVDAISIDLENQEEFIASLKGATPEQIAMIRQLRNDLRVETVWDVATGLARSVHKTTSVSGPGGTRDGWTRYTLIVDDAAGE